MSIAEQDWDVLIILDACRYDYFKKNYKDFFKGKLKKKESLGRATTEWFKKNFKVYRDDIVYISGNPYLNSKVKIDGILASNNFHKVVDVWDFGWDHKNKTVKPEEVSKSYLKVRSSYPDKRFVLHYMQPHFPYIKLSETEPESRINTKARTNAPENSITIFIGDILQRFHITRKLKNKIREVLNTPYPNQMVYILEKYNLEKLREEYEKNLLLALKDISKLIQEIKKTVVITSDHGEMLGEHGKFGHSENYKRYKELVEVPYLEIKKIKQ